MPHPGRRACALHAASAGTRGATRRDMTRATASNQVESINVFMTASHRHLSDLYDRVLEALEVNAPDLRDLWTDLDHGLLAHLEAEERYVLPAFAHIDREEARALLREHGLIRERLLELGVAVDLHLGRYEAGRELVDMLRAHADREDKLLYRWADEQLDTSLAEAARRHVSNH